MSSTDPGTPRLAVRKTCKLYVGGAFPRSESGRTYDVHAADGTFLAHAARASRKDARDALTAARGAASGWAGRTAYNRGQVIYRVAEMMESRRAQLVDDVAAAEGVDAATAGAQVDAAVDRVVWYAGWTDKLAQVLGNANPVAGPFLNVSVPEPTGVVTVLAPQGSSLLGLVSVVVPVLATGSTAVVLTSEARPVPAVTLGEALATSDVPGGVVNLLTGPWGDTAPTLAAHLDLDGLDLTGLSGDTERRDLAVSLEQDAAESLTRVLRPTVEEPDWAVDPGLGRLRRWTETKTVWHPRGL